VAKIPLVAGSFYDTAMLEDSKRLMVEFILHTPSDAVSSAPQ
jgi:hypothetical protein